MRPRSGVAAVTQNPVLIGVATVLIVIAGVFLSYNANKGLPLVPTYDVTVELPSAAELTDGNDVRIAGLRVGVIDSIKPAVHGDGTVTAKLKLKLKKSVEPLPKDSTIAVRQRSTLGVKFLEITQGSSDSGEIPNGGAVALHQAKPSVDLDRVLNMFDYRTRQGVRGSLHGFGDALAGRGQDLNVVIQQLAELLNHLEPVARNLADPATRLGLFVHNAGSVVSILASVALAQADLFVNMDSTFSALADVTDSIQRTISAVPPSEAQLTADLPGTRPLLQNLRLLAVDLRPGARVLPAVSSDLADVVTVGTSALKRDVAFNHQLATSLHTLQEFSQDAQVPLALTQVDATVMSLDPLIAFITPAQTICNYAAVLLRNFAQVSGEGDANGRWQRVEATIGQPGVNGEAAPSAAAANGPEAGNYLHSNFYPNTAAPGQTRECEAGNEKWVENQQLIGNQPGNQGVGTDTFGTTTTTKR